MAPRSRTHRRTTGRIAAILLAWLTFLVGPAARADSDVHYFADRVFEIPYSCNPDPSFGKLHLHVSTDGGKTYATAGSALDLRGAFTYNAKADGWYWFVVQLERTDGTFVPKQVNLVEPSQRVYVDTLKPKIKLEQIAPRIPGHVTVQWSIDDASLELRSLRLEYRPTGAARWIPLSVTQLQAAHFTWNPTARGPLEVRLTVSDKAKNTGEFTTQVRADAASPSTPAPSAISAVPTGDRPVHYVNRKDFKLTYALDKQGNSGVKHVEVWRTRNTTQWSLISKPENSGGSVDISVPSQGRYGFTLRPVSGVGRGKKPPSAGDLPQIWVEVDETKPKVSLHSVVVNEGDDPSTITVNWVAQDNFFPDQPITIYYSKSLAPDAKWEVLQANVENTGTYKCKVDSQLFEFYVRVEATDRAGNKAHDQTRETVKVDLAEPDVKDVNVKVKEDDGKPPGP